MAQAGLVASLALLLVVPLTIWAYSALSPLRAVLVVFFASALFLPELANFDAPLIPPLDKQSIPALALLIGALVTARKDLKQARIGRAVDLLALLVLIAIAGTMLTNPDALTYGTTTLSGFGPHDATSEMVRSILSPIAPFFLGRVLCRHSEHAEDLLRVLVVAGLIYAPFVLIEWRLSPQLHYWVYGYAQHSFSQTVRGEGSYRPMCFMSHGLALALFVCVSMLSAWTLSRAGKTLFGWPMKYFAVALSILLVMVNSFGALIYGLVLVPLIWFLSPRWQLRFAIALAAATALYPVARAAELFPTQELVDLAARASQERAASLQFRFEHEDMLLEKALERPWLGWGGNSRYRIFNAAGRDISVTDGAWIIILGAYGAVGFVARFGLLLVPVWMASRSLGRVSPERQPLLSGLALSATIYSLDLLPNGLFNDIPLFLSGAVAGLALGMPNEAQSRLPLEALVRWLLARRLESVRGVP